MSVLIYTFLSFYITLLVFDFSEGAACGCKQMRSCYENMLEILRDQDEAKCVEDASFGSSGIMIYLTAIAKYCKHVVTVNSQEKTVQGRKLFEVIITRCDQKGQERTDARPTILIDAGQSAGEDPTDLALFIIEQLVACKENSEMFSNWKWVILPSTNPDGRDYAQAFNPKWTKNLKESDNKMAFGVDISRNFNYQWESCSHVTNVFSPKYAGPRPASENETIFIKRVIEDNKSNLKAYISLRRNGHAILYAPGYTKNKSQKSEITKAAGEIAAAVNIKAGSVQAFMNESIYEFHGEARCGHSVDYVSNLGVDMSFEMKVFPRDDDSILSNFQTLPRGYVASLRAGYFAGIKRLFTILTEKKGKTRT